MTPMMNRRDAVKATGVLLGGAVVASSGVLSACKAEPRAREASKDANAKVAPQSMVLREDDQALIESIADTILPDTPSSPGAKAGGGGAAVNLLLTDVYDAAATKRVVDGLATLRTRSAAFVTLPASERVALLRTIDIEAKQAGPAHWFHLVHELSMKAYFSSEIGMTKALRYVREPGRFNGCVPMKPGQPAWG
jgi:Gluconate 2-dehydrogenase subunit 3